MFERILYVVVRLDGDYAYLLQIEEDGTILSGVEEKCVARALLPGDTDEGTKLAYEMLEYSKIG